MGNARSELKVVSVATDAPFTTVEEADGGTVFRCALCGTSFTHGGRTCGSCPLGAACDIVSCPNCGYGFPRGSRVVDWARRTWSRLRGE